MNTIRYSHGHSTRCILQIKASYCSSSENMTPFGVSFILLAMVHGFRVSAIIIFFTFTCLSRLMLVDNIGILFVEIEVVAKSSIQSSYLLAKIIVCWLIYIQIKLVLVDKFSILNLC